MIPSLHGSRGLTGRECFMATLMTQAVQRGDMEAAAECRRQLAVVAAKRSAMAAREHAA